MSTSTEAQPILSKLKNLAAAEKAGKEQADARALQLERALADAREAQRVRATRHLAAEAAVTAAEDYFTQLAATAGTTAEDTPSDARATESATEWDRNADASARPVNDLILDVLELGQVTPLASIYEGVQRVRPGTSGGAIRGQLTNLNRRGVVEIVSRGVYRLLVIPEGYQAPT
ncbi:hypothetical protein ACF09E_30680 [Streptomyces sp. NPDC014891]|uniref:hypothetical protein n=1 Tax=Streptomyces sp. NPDC014891 TaxID=3364929 RepID=UPI0036FDA5B2